MSITITQGCRFYLEEWAIPQKCDVYRTRPILKFFIRTLGPAKLLADVTEADLHEAMALLEREGKAPSTRRRIYAIYSAMANHNQRKKRVKEVAKITPPPAGEPVRESFTEEQVAQLFATPMPYRAWIFFVVDFETAARSRAIEQLTVGRCDFGRRIVQFALPNVNHKKKRRGEVPMSDALCAALWDAAHRDGPPWRDDLIVPPGKDPRPGWPPHVQPYIHGQVVRPSSSTYNLCDSIVRKAGLKRRWVARHIGRKTFATLAAEHDVSTFKIAALMHDTVNTIDRSYVFLRADRMHSLVNSISVTKPRAPAPA